MNRAVNDYVQRNWEAIRSDLAVDEFHQGGFDARHRVGQGYYMAEREARPALEKVRAFLHGYVADAGGLDEVRRELQLTAQVNGQYLRQDLAALEMVLAERSSPGTLVRLVEDDGNWGLDDDPTDAGAVAFLAELVRMLRAVLVVDE